MKKIILSIFIFLCFINVEATSKTKVKLYSCIDGDTAKFTMKKEVITVRFLAIDAPEIKHGKTESQPYGDEASNYTCNELKKAKTIYLEFDKNSDLKDRYDRYLAWIFVDDNLLQEKIIKKGFAKTAYLYDDYKYIDILKKQESKAHNKKLGIWSDTTQKKLEINYEFISENYIYIIILILILLLICIISKKANKDIKKQIRKKLKKYK